MTAPMDDGSGTRTGGRNPGESSIEWQFARSCLIAAIALIVAVPLGIKIFASVVVGDHFVTSRTEFDREDWLEADAPWWADADRIRMLDDTFRRHLQPGSSRQAVIATLGEPYATVPDGDGVQLWYELGDHATDHWWLIAQFSPEDILIATRHGDFARPRR